MHREETIKIGTRKSALALWQAEHVQEKLAQKGLSTELVLISSSGDQNLQQPLYEMGVQGIFTKALDIALLDHQIDLAVHSLKDVPTRLPEGLMLSATPQRGDAQDALVLREALQIADLNNRQLTVATSSLRRAAQWLARYPHHRIVNTRGNIQTRIRRVDEDDSIDATIIAAVGPARIQLDVPNLHPLDWMIPAPSQGALGIVCRAADEDLLEVCRSIEHARTRAAVRVERAFLRALQAGCTMPVAAHAKWQQEVLHFKAAVHSIDGRQAVHISKTISGTDYSEEGALIANELLEKGGRS